MGLTHVSPPPSFHFCSIFLNSQSSFRFARFSLAGSRGSLLFDRFHRRTRGATFSGMVFTSIISGGPAELNLHRSIFTDGSAELPSLCSIFSAELTLLRLIFSRGRRTREVHFGTRCFSVDLFNDFSTQSPLDEEWGDRMSLFLWWLEKWGEKIQSSKM